MRLTIPQHQLTLSGNTAGALASLSSGTVTLAGGNNITLSQVGNAITISGATQTVQTQGILSAGVSTAGNTAGNTTVNTGSQLVLVGTNMVSLSQTTAAGASTITFDATNQNLSAGVSTGGNTAGNTTVNTGSRLVLAGGNNITLSQSTAAGATTITVSAPNLGAGAFSGGASNLGNTAGDTGITGTRLVFVGTNNISLSQATDANGGTLSINNTVSNYSLGVSTGGNTAGSTGVTGTRYVLVGSNMISLSQSTDMAGGTVTIDGPPPISHWQNFPLNTGAGIQTTNLTASSRSLFFFPFTPNGGFPARMTASSARMLLSISASTASVTQAHSFGISLGVYRISASNARSTLSLLNSVGQSWTKTTLAASEAVNSYFGNRWVEFASSAWSSEPVFSANVHYVGAIIYSWSNISFNTLALWAGSVATAINASGTINAASATNTSRGIHPWMGIYTATSTAFPTSVHLSQLSKTQGQANLVPFLEFDALYSVH